MQGTTRDPRSPFNKIVLKIPEVEIKRLTIGKMRTRRSRKSIGIVGTSAHDVYVQPLHFLCNIVDVFSGSESFLFLHLLQGLYISLSIKVVVFCIADAFSGGMQEKLKEIRQKKQRRNRFQPVQILLFLFLRCD